MNTRRGFIGKSIAAVAAMFGISQVALARETRPTLHKFVRGFWPAPDVRQARLEQCDKWTENICLDDLANPRTADTVLADLGKDIEAKVDKLLREGATKINVQWMNIPDRHANPFSLVGFFHIRGWRVTDGSSAQDFIASGVLPLSTTWDDIPEAR